MTSRSLQAKVLHPRKGNSLEAERENFEKTQNISITKAINQQEIPVKEKHVRSAIIGTFSDKGAKLFWSVVTKLPLQGNPIVVLEVFACGSQTFERRPSQYSQKYVKTLVDIGKLWGHLKEGYGRLILQYSKLLIVKLEFHKRNLRFPGNLHVTDEQLENIGENDVNNYFQMAVEMFDYVDEILALQSAVFGSLDMSRSNSMTNSGQCRLAPLIPCIQDSSHLYDFCVKLLFKMHSSLPPDLLSGHRERFLKQFKVLQQFYISSSNLQYFKYLIQIPLLPENPPNFFVASDLNSHVSPVVILPPQAETPDRDVDSVDMNLVDTSSNVSSSPTRMDESFHSERSNGHQIDDRDMEIAELKKQIEYLQNIIFQLESQHKQSELKLKERIESLEKDLKQSEENVETRASEISQLQEQSQHHDHNTTLLLTDYEKKVKINEEKFNKMKEVYTKLRDEHITLIRVKAELDRHISSMQKKESITVEQLQQQVNLLQEQQASVAVDDDRLQEVSSQLQKVICDKSNMELLKIELESKFNESEVEKVSLVENVAKLEDIRKGLERKLAETEADNENMLEKQRSESFMKQLDMLASVLDEASSLVENTLNDIDSQSFVSNTSMPEFLMEIINGTSKSLEDLSSGHTKFTENNQDIEMILGSIMQFAHNVTQSILQGKAACNISPDIELGDELNSLCKTFGKNTLQLFSALRNKDMSENVEESLDLLRSNLQNMSNKTGSLISKSSGSQVEEIGEMIVDEMTSMDKAIEEAAQRIADLLNKSRTADTGIKLEVNGKILDSCTGLMQAIKMLVTSSKHLQTEVVSQGRGSCSATEFYKRNHRWTEGLLSAAKEVGMGAKFLVEAADKVVNGKGKFEELVVASQGISAGTAQLVIASRVKADKDSQCLHKLSTSSKQVTQATGNVVATAKDCAELIEDSDCMDFSKLSLHQAKRYEMESQVRVLELESNLQKERMKLANLRRQHYQMAGPSEGWESTVSIPE
ncbi:Huntingtin-interacting protein 1 [Nymphon striatum]|nr:Huntingtin-interacting protein 1 [Nymphon striatum]